MAIMSTRTSPLRSRHAFTLLEILVVIAIISVLFLLLAPILTGINEGSRVTKAVNDVSGMLELARAEAMSARSYVYVGVANTVNADGNAEIHMAALISMDGSNNTTAANLRPVTKLARISNVQMTNYTNLPQTVRSIYGSDPSLNQNSEYVVMFATRDYFQTQFNDSALDSCPTLVIAPTGEIAHESNPTVFFRTTASIGLAPMHGTTVINTDGAIVTYYGGTGQLRVSRPL